MTTEFYSGALSLLGQLNSMPYEMFSVPGLTCQLRHTDLFEATRVYHALENFQERSADVSQYVLGHLGHIFAKYDAHRIFGIVPMHRYRELAQDEVLVVGALSAPPDSYRERTIKTRDLDVARVRGDCFAVESNGNIVPYKLRQGKVAPFNVGNNEFLQEFSAYMLDMGLNDILGLQLLREELPRGVEHNLEEGTVFATGFKTPGNTSTKQNVWVFHVDPKGNTKYKQTVYISVSDLPDKRLMKAEIAASDFDDVSVSTRPTEMYGQRV